MKSVFFIIAAFFIGTMFFLIFTPEEEPIKPWWEHPATKRFWEDPYTNYETFTKENEPFQCGWISKEKESTPWDKDYVAYFFVNENKEIMKTFKTLGAAETWLFSQGCPSVKWGLR